MPTNPLRSTRRAMIAGGASVVGTASLAAMIGRAAAQSDRGLLDLLVALEELQIALYDAILTGFDERAFTDAGLPAGVREQFDAMLAAERAHLAILRRPEEVDTAPGVSATPASLDQALQEAIALENFVTAAYAGVIPLLDRDRLVSDILGIHSVEARHATWLTTLAAGNPFPDDVDAALSPEEVLARLEPIADQGATPVAGGDVPAPVLGAIAAELGVTADTLQMVEIESTDWPDASLGCPRPGEAYAQVITPGYVVVVQSGGEEITFHTDTEGSVVRCP